MDADITKLAELLRQNGDKISNGSCKFTLTSDLLNHLNSSFNLILERREALTSSFHVLNITNENNARYRDLYFLYDFIQLVKSLKLTKNQISDSREEFIDISKFKELSYLELHKIDLNRIVGISQTRMKLQYLICERCLNNLGDVLENCGADQTEPQTWCELKEAIFTHNSISQIDTSLNYVPWLNTLDLSNNLIEEADGISCLMNLKYLNLSFNRLMKLPLFNGQICRRLQILVLHNNFIDDIHDVYKLVNLQQLNLMDNCLVEHDSLIPLSYLATLQSLNLHGNPLSYHPQHRIRSVRYLHKNTASVKFILDDTILNKAEQQSISSLHPKMLVIDQSSSSNDTSDIFDRSVRLRQAIIADDDILECLETSLPVFPTNTSPIENIDSKEQMASLHKDYIKILYDKAGVNTKSSPKDSFMSSTPLGESILNTIQDTLKEEDRSNNTTTDYVTASEQIDDKVYQDEDDNDDDKEEEIVELSDDEELESGESNIFSASIKGGNDIIVIVTQTHITEKDPINMKSLGRFALDSLTICDLFNEGGIDYVHLEFDTVRINSSRYYAIELVEDRQRLFDKLRGIIESKPPKEISNLFTCMKCSTTFGVEDQKTLHREETVCPVCRSNLVFEENRA